MLYAAICGVCTLGHTPNRACSATDLKDLHHHRDYAWVFSFTTPDARLLRSGGERCRGMGLCSRGGLTRR
jgi:hypothetical protein